MSESVEVHVPEVVRLPVGGIRAAPRNPNRMEPERYNQLVEDIRGTGFLQPILVRPVGDGYEVVDGHHRLEAARGLGMAEVPCVVVTLDEATALAEQVGMNRRRGELDLASVAAHFHELAGMGWSPEDMGATGFTPDEVADLLQAGQTSAADLLAEGMAALPGEAEEKPTRPYVLEVEFTDKLQYQAAKKALRRAAGKGGSLADGLLRLAGLDEQEGSSDGDQP